GADGQIGDEVVLGFAGAVRDELPVAGLPADGHGLHRLGYGADLVELDQRGVGDAARDGAGDDGRVGAEDVVADQLRGAAQAGGERDPAVFVIFAEAVLDQVHGELPGDGREPVDHVSAGQQVVGHLVAAIGLPELRGGQVE